MEGSWEAEASVLAAFILNSKFQSTKTLFKQLSRAFTRRKGTAIKPQMRLEKAKVSHTLLPHDKHEGSLTRQLAFLVVLNQQLAATNPSAPGACALTLRMMECLSSIMRTCKISVHSAIIPLASMPSIAHALALLQGMGTAEPRILSNLITAMCETLCGQMTRLRPSIFDPIGLIDDGELSNESTKHSYDAMQRARVDLLVDGVASLGEWQVSSVVRCLCLCSAAILQGEWAAQAITDLGYLLMALERCIKLIKLQRRTSALLADDWQSEMKTLYQCAAPDTDTLCKQLPLVQYQILHVYAAAAEIDKSLILTWY